MSGGNGDSPGSFYPVMDTSPPDYVEKISRYLDSVDSNKNDGESNTPGGADSDSGDSLFITQKDVPEAVRSRRLRHNSLSSKAAPPRQVKGGKSIKSKLKDERKKRRKYSLPFSREPKHMVCSITDLNFTMGGFFKCISELRQHHQEGKDFKSSLPTLDWEDIVPLSEEEEEKSEDEDIKVVAKRCLVAPSKATNQQSWFSQSKHQRSTAASKKSGRQRLHVKPTILKVIPTSSDTERSDDGESSGNVLDHRPRRRATARTRSAESRRTRGHKEVVPLRNAREETPRTISDAACELRRSRRLITRKSSVASTPVPSPVGDRLGSQRIRHSLPDIISDIKEKMHDEAPEGQSDETYVDLDVEETPSLFENNRADSPAAQTTDELEVHGKNGMEHSQKKKKRKKKSAAENVDGNLESDVRAEDPVYSERSAEDAEKTLFSPVFEPINDEAEMTMKKKKKKKKKKRSAEDADQPLFSAVFQPLSDEGEMKGKPEGLCNETYVDLDVEETPSLFEGNRADSPAAQTTDELEVHGKNGMEHSQRDGSVLRQEEGNIPGEKQKKKKRKKKSAAENVDGNLESDVRAEDPVYSERSAEDTEQPQFSAVLKPLNDDAEIKKKKKKKKRKKEEIAEEATTLDPPAVSTEPLEEPGYYVENATAAPETESRRKKRKKKQKLSSHDANGDVSVCLDDSVITDQCEKKKWETVFDELKTKEDQNTELVTKKKKKKRKRSSSFLAADAEENQAHTHVEQNYHSPSGVWDAEQPDVSTADLEDCVTKRKKKRKRKMLMVQDGVGKDQDFESNTEVKRKRTGSESKSATAMERSESAADAGVSDKKKKKKKKCKEETGNIVEETPGDQTLNYKTDKKKKKSKDGRGDMVEDQTLNETSDGKKKKKIKSTDVSLVSETEDVELEPRIKKKKHKKERNEQSADPQCSLVLPQSKMSPSGTVMKKVKRRLLDPSEDFLLDC